MSCHLSVSEDQSNDVWDVIMWMDHRASKETDLINSLGHPGNDPIISFLYL